MGRRKHHERKMATYLSHEGVGATDDNESHGNMEYTRKRHSNGCHSFYSSEDSASSDSNSNDGGNRNSKGRYSYNMDGTSHKKRMNAMVTPMQSSDAIVINTEQ